MKDYKTEAKILESSIADGTKRITHLVNTHNDTLTDHESTIDDINTNHIHSIATLQQEHDTQYQAAVGNHEREMKTAGVATENRIKAINEIHAGELKTKAAEIKLLSQKLIADRRSSNMVSLC